MHNKKDLSRDFLGSILPFLGNTFPSKIKPVMHTLLRHLNIRKIEIMFQKEQAKGRTFSEISLPHSVQRDEEVIEFFNFWGGGAHKD